MDKYQVIKKPLLTEKAYAGIPSKRYAFIVDKNADKTQIKLAVQDLFPGTVVEKVNTVNIKGKYKRQGKHEGYTSDYKKAYVQLTEKSKEIDFFKSLV